MVTKKKITETKAPTKRVKVGKLQLNKETVKELTASEKKQIQGGATHATFSVIAPFCQC